MRQVIDAVSDFYNMKLQKTSDFEQELEECSKEDLIEFIMEHQARGCFGRGIIHD